MQRSLKTGSPLQSGKFPSASLVPVASWAQSGHPKDQHSTTGNLYKESNCFYYKGARQHFTQHNQEQTSVFYKTIPESSNRKMEGTLSVMILIRQCLRLKLHVTPTKCNHFLANMAKKSLLLDFVCLHTYQNMPTMKNVFSRHSVTPASTRAQIQPVVPNTRKYKMIGNININLYFKFITFYLQK